MPHWLSHFTSAACANDFIEINQNLIDPRSFTSWLHKESIKKRRAKRCEAIRYSRMPLHPRSLTIIAI